MKVTRLITTELELDLDISEATLLTIKEAEQLPERLRNYRADWWLRSHGCNSSRVAVVDDVGCVLDYGYRVNFGNSLVRPVLAISNLKSSGLKIGYTFVFRDKEFEIISNDKAFCLEDIGTCVFRKDWQANDANDYEKSDIKKYIDNWFDGVKEWQTLNR